MATRSFVAGLALGAGLAYFLDPRDGGRRRQHAGARLDAWLARLGRSGRTPPRHYGMRMGDLAGLEAANLPAAPPPGSASPSLAVLAAGGALAVYGLSRRGGLATLARTLGAALLGGGLRAAPAAAPQERRRVVDIQKSVHIDAPVADVFAFWDSYESFPLFMSGVREIEDLGGGRSRWVVDGPDGEISWEAVLTQRSPGQLIAWRSEPGSMLENAGVIRFTPDAGGTRVDLRLCYQPPAGGAGPAVAALLGADPRETLNHDLGRLKAVLESSGRSGVHGQEPGT